MDAGFSGPTDILYIEFRDRGIAQSKDVDEHTVLDLDADGLKAKPP
jgi:uncharacterized protein YuzE